MLLLILVHQGTLQELVSHMGPGVGMVHQVFQVKKNVFFHVNGITVISTESVAWGRHFVTILGNENLISHQILVCSL